MTKEEIISKWEKEIAKHEDDWLDKYCDYDSKCQIAGRLIAIMNCLDDLKKLNITIVSEGKVCNAPKGYVCNVNDKGICKLPTFCYYQKQT